MVEKEKPTDPPPAEEEEEVIEDEEEVDDEQENKNPDGEIDNDDVALSSDSEDDVEALKEQLKQMEKKNKALLKTNKQIKNNPTKFRKSTKITEEARKIIKQKLLTKCHFVRSVEQMNKLCENVYKELFTEEQIAKFPKDHYDMFENDYAKTFKSILNQVKTECQEKVMILLMGNYNVRIGKPVISDDLVLCCSFQHADEKGLR